MSGFNEISKPNIEKKTIEFVFTLNEVYKLYKNSFTSHWVSLKYYKHFINKRFSPIFPLFYS